jgi:hypothetical protein
MEGLPSGEINPAGIFETAESNVAGLNFAGYQLSNLDISDWNSAC